MAKRRLPIDGGEYQSFVSRFLSSSSRGWPCWVILAIFLAPDTIRVAAAQTAVCPDLKPGVVVESVSKNSEGERAGIAAGDLITAWTGTDSRGDVLSPFDLMEIETEQEPRGRVILQGYRSGSARRWAMGADIWGLQAHPNLGETDLATYQVGRELANADKISEAVERWRTLSGSLAYSCISVRAWFLYHAAKTSVKIRHWKESDDLFREAIELTSASEPYLTSNLMDEWGDTFSQRYELDKAEDEYRRALALLQERAPSSIRLTILLNALGVIARERGDLASARGYYRQALEIQQRVAPLSLTVADTFGNLGLAAFDAGDLEEAEDYSHQALALQRKVAPGSLHESFTLINLADMALDRGDLKNAEDYYAQAMSEQQKFAPGKVGAIFLLNLGVVALDRGELDKAEDYFQQTVVSWQKAYPGSLDLAQVLSNLGSVNYQRGDLARAEDYFRQALTIEQKVAPSSLTVARTLDSLGDVARKGGEPDKAEDYYKQALDIQQKAAPDGLDSADSLAAIGGLTRESRNLERSELYYQQALDIRRRLAPEGVDYAETLAGLAAALRGRGNLERSANLYAEALDVFDQQMGMLGGSSNIRAGFRAQHSKFYFEYADLLIKQNRPDLAFDVMERAHSRTLLESLAEAHINIRQGADPASIEKEHLLRATLDAKANRKIDLLSNSGKPERIAEIDKEIANVLRQYQELESQIRSTSPRYASLTQPKPLTAREVQARLLDTDTVLLEYILGDERSYLFIVTSNTLDAVKLPKRSEIESSSRHVYELLNRRARPLAAEKHEQLGTGVSSDDEEYKEAAENLSKMLLQPVAKQLEGKRLLIVADGALHYIPFGALPTPAVSASVPRTEMIAEHEIVNLPSASVLEVLRQQAASRSSKPSRQLAIFADPVFDKSDPRVEAVNRKPTELERTAPLSGTASEASGDVASEHLTRSLNDVEGARSGTGLARLLFSRREAKAIMAMTDPTESLEALDFQANRETAASKVLAQYRVVHFATHGLLDNEHPELSGLVLSLVDSSGKSQDGFLDLEDIYNLELPADLVVLSACETGLGKEISGEGLVGLTRGFMYAGASRVVASLWPVNDAATAELMGAFYKGMLKEGLRPAAALRKAQQQLMQQKRWHEPYYWAAFTLQGDWN